MKFKLIALAALVAAGSAQALSPAAIDAARTAKTLKEVRLSGSSAYRLAIAGYIKSICNSDLDVYYSAANLLGATESAGGAARAYACTLNADLGNWKKNDAILVYKRDTGGSYFGVAPIAANTAIGTIKVDSTSCTTPRTDTAGDVSKANYTCSQSENSIQDAGFSDLEPALLNLSPNLIDGAAPINLSPLTVKTFWQAIFGVAVNLKTYRALQTAQGLTQDDSDANRPSLSKNWIRTAMGGAVDTSAAGLQGWNLVLGSAGDGKAVNVCRREPGSGTQATAQKYFLQNPCDSQNKGIAQRGVTTNPSAVVVDGPGTNVVEVAATGDVINCLKAAENANAYAFGIFGRDNIETNQQWRYVRIDGALPNRYVSSTQGAVHGTYDFVAEGTINWNTARVNANADLLAFLTAVSTKANTPAAIGTAPSSGSSRTSDGFMAAPGVWFATTANGYWTDLNASTERPFASRLSHTGQDSSGVSRSCSILNTL